MFFLDFLSEKMHNPEPFPLVKQPILYKRSNICHFVAGPGYGSVPVTIAVIAALILIILCLTMADVLNLSMSATPSSSLAAKENPSRPKEAP